MTDYTPESYRIVHLTTVDFNKRILPRPIHIVQYDDSIPILAVSLYLDGNQYTIPNSAEMNIRFGKKDGTFVYNPALGCSPDRHTVYFEVTQQMTTNRGIFNPIVEMVVDGNIAGSSCIDIEIDRNPIQETDIESNTEFITMKEYADKAKISEEKASASESSASMYADLIQESYTTMVEELNKKADKTDVETSLTLKQNTLVLDSTPTIGSANFVNSDRIAAALSYKADSKDLFAKADKTNVEASLLLKENTANKISDILNITDKANNYPSLTYLEEYYYDFTQADEQFIPKTKENGGGVVTDYIANKAVTLTKLNDDVTILLNSKADSDSVISNADGAVKENNIVDDAVTSSKIANGAVTAIKLSNNAVGTGTLADDAVSNAKLKSNSVSTEKIVDGAVTLAKLGIDANARINSKANQSDLDSLSTLVGTANTNLESRLNGG